MIHHPPAFVANTSPRMTRSVWLGMVCIVGLLILPLRTYGQAVLKVVASERDTSGGRSAVWVPDQGDGTYANPVLFADYSDPDIVRVGKDFYLTSSSFSQFPGLPILHSNDLVNWTIIGHAVARYPIESFNVPQHGNGIWAPAIRYHNGEYFIYFGDPDNGIFMTKAAHPEGPWSPLVLVKKAKGWIDPCPLWDDDGSVYLVHAWAFSRSGIKSILTVNKMSPDGARIIDDGVTVFDGRVDQPTIEGPKFYKRDGYYYIFAPAGGVKQGWQTVLRSRSVYGPYETKKVLVQGSSSVNGPHQGAWVETPDGGSWFVHFQDRGVYGRVVHLEPLRWVEGWPVIGSDLRGTGIGEPVDRYRKPSSHQIHEIQVPQTDDEFSESAPGLQWQWESNADSDWYSLQARKGWLRLFPQPLKNPGDNRWSLGGILGQKIPGPEFSCTVSVDADSLLTGEEAGLTVLGTDYSSIAIRKASSGYSVVRTKCEAADRRTREQEIDLVKCDRGRIQFRVEWSPGAMCRFSYSSDGKIFSALGSPFQAVPGKWVGARLGLFSLQRVASSRRGFADFDWIHFRQYR